MTALSRTVVRNLVVLAVAILPLWFALAWLTGEHGNAQDESTWYAVTIGYFFVGVPVLIAGTVQQLVLVLFVRTTKPRSRWPAVLTVGVIPFVLNLVGAPLDVQFSRRFAVATLVSLLVFGLLMRRPYPATT